MAVSLGMGCRWRVYALVLGAAAGLAASQPALGQPSGESRLDQVVAGKLLRVCIWPDYFGITYRNPKTLELSGIDVELALALGKELGARVEFVDSSFSRLIDDLAQERCHVAMFAVGITPARQKRLAFTQPHLQSGIYAIASRSNRRIRKWDNIDRPGTVVAVAKGTFHESVMRDYLKQAQLVVLDSPHGREIEVQSGRADVFMTDFPYGQHFLARGDWARRIDPPAAFHVTPYAYAVQPGDERWLQRLDRFVQDIKRDGRLQAAAARYKLEAIVKP